jgi:UDP-2-acetamido-2-deoxy-ribo-hexuluronate aminotransferase
MWLKIQQERIKKQIDNNISKVMEHGQYILGPEVSLLEEKLSSYGISILKDYMIH